MAPGTVFSAEDLKTISEIAGRFGNGTVACTTRLAVEIIGIPYEKIEPAREYAKERGLCFGGTGAKVRPVTACKGTTCIYGNFDTQGLAGKSTRTTMWAGRMSSFPTSSKSLWAAAPTAA